VAEVRCLTLARDLQALSEKTQEALEAFQEVGELKRSCQGHTQQVQDLERLLGNAGEEVAHVGQLREASAACERRAEVKPTCAKKSHKYFFEIHMEASSEFSVAAGLAQMHPVQGNTYEPFLP
jgi:septal ring factor EnvC (AmiA/AmiB activator)